MFDWVLIHLWRVFVLEISRKLTCGNSFCKITDSKTLNSMKQDSIREKIWKRILLRKSPFKITEKEKHSWMFSYTCNLLEMDASSDHFLET